LANNTYKKSEAPTQSKKRKKKKSKRSKALWRALVIILVIAAIALSVAAGAFVGFVDNSMDLIAEEYNLDFASIIYYIDEETNEPVEFDRIHRAENRTWADIADIPDNLTNAFIAIEDERFREHKGVDLKRTFGAFVQYMMGRDSYGGSTITQQLVKNITGDKDRSPIRKIQEIIRAVNLEKKMSKDQIIEMYMNTIYFSGGCHGVQTAANYYFGKDVSELSLAQCASIAGIVKAPTTYNPATNYENNKDRQEVILTKMAKLGMISQKECDEAKKADLELKVGKVEEARTDIKSYFVDAVITDVINDLMEKENLTESEATNRLYTGGFKIYSTADPKVQSAIDKVFENTANFPGSGANKPQSAMVVIDPYTGHVKGLAGGIGEKTVNRGFNMATMAVRQPGSAIKPLAVYAPAIEYNVVTAATIVNDAPFKIGDWEPKNSGGGYKGKLSVRRHIELSRNIPAIKVMQALSVNRAFDFMTKKLGFTTMVAGETRNGELVSDKSLSMALGGLTDGVTVEEMTAAYATFVNSGKYNRPITYTKVIDANGKVVLENKTENKRAMSEQTAYIMQNMLSGVVRSGTGTSAGLSGIYAGGKTGTTNGNKDRWFVGFTPNYVGGVWMGHEIPKAMSGSNYCPRIWKMVMTEIHKGETIKTIGQPKGLVKRTICQQTGFVASEICTETRDDYFKEGTQPMKLCVSHEEEGVEGTETETPGASQDPSTTPGGTEEIEDGSVTVSPGTDITNDDVTPDDGSTEGDSEDTWFGEE